MGSWGHGWGCYFPFPISHFPFPISHFMFSSSSLIWNYSLLCGSILVESRNRDKLPICG